MADRLKNVKQNVAFNYLYQFTNLLLSFISRNIFLKTFGLEYLGLNGIFTDVLGMLSIMDLGMNTAVIFSFYKPIAEDDKKTIAGLVHFYKKIYSFIALAILIVGIAIIPFLKYIINVQREIDNLVLYYLIALINTVCSYLFIYKTSIITASQKEYINTIIRLFSNFFKTILQIAVMIYFKNYIVYLIIGTLSIIVSNALASYKADKMFPFINNSYIELSTENKKTIITTSGSVFLFKISSTLLNMTDNIIISTIISTGAVGLYSNYLSLQNNIMSFFVTLFSSAVASVGHLVVTEIPSKRFLVFKCEQSISYFLGFIIVPCYSILANDFISIWLGSQYLLESSVVYAISLNIYFSCIFQPLWSFREATGLYVKTKWAIFTCAVLNIILSFAFGYVWGLFGIIFASVISKLLTYFWYEPYILFKEYFNVNPLSFYLNTFKYAFFTMCIIMIIKYITASFIVTTYLTWFIKAIICGSICLISSLIIMHKDEGLILLIDKYIKKLRSI